MRPLSLRLAKGLQLARIHHAVAVGVHALESAMQKLILLLGRQRREPTELRLPMLKALALLGRQIRSCKALADKGLRVFICWSCCALY